MNSPARSSGAADAKPSGSRSLQRERLVFTIAAALTAVGVLLGTVLIPPPGVGRGTQWAAALVPLPALGVAAWLYPRMRPGLRAVVSLVFGALAIVAGVIALVNIGGGRAFPSDWFAVLLLPAGIVLAVLGTRLLWSSRKRSGRRFLRRSLIAVAGLLALYWVLLPIALAMMATQTARGERQPAWPGTHFERATLRTADGVNLAARYVASRNGAAIILFPGSWTKRQAQMLASHGYGVLLLDLRGYGESQGQPDAYGWGSTRDIDAGVAWLLQRPDVEPGRIGGLGLSVGGEQMLEAAAGNRNLGAVVSEGAGQRSVREALLRGPSGWFSLPMDAVQTAALAVLTGRGAPASLSDLVAQIAPRPVLLVYAERGQGGEELNVEYYRASRRPRQIWLVRGAEHTNGIGAAPQEYERRVVNFFDRWLLR